MSKVERFLDGDSGELEEIVLSVADALNAYASFHLSLDYADGSATETLAVSELAERIDTAIQIFDKDHELFSQAVAIWVSGAMNSAAVHQFASVFGDMLDSARDFLSLGITHDSEQYEVYEAIAAFSTLSELWHVGGDLIEDYAGDRFNDIDNIRNAGIFEVMRHELNYEGATDAQLIYDLRDTFCDLSDCLQEFVDTYDGLLN